MHNQMAWIRQWGPTGAVIAFAALSTVANLLQLRQAGGIWVWVSLASGAVVVVVVVARVTPLLRRTSRGDWLFESIRRSGLAEIEHREGVEHRFPPSKIFGDPRWDLIVLSGILDQVAQQNLEDLEGFVQRGGTLKILLLHPELSADSFEQSWAGGHDEWVRYWVSNADDADGALDGFVRSGLLDWPRTQLKFIRRLPPYFGLLACRSDSPGDGGRGVVRVQPLALSKRVGRGTVLMFESSGNQRRTPYDYYSEDFLAQWDAATEDRDLIAQRSANRGPSV